MDTMSLDSYRRLLARQEAEDRKKGEGHRHEESNLQIECVKWFRGLYRSHANLLFAVPNGARVKPSQARILKAEGLTSGVSDLLLLEPRGGYGCLCIEMKTTAKSSRQGDTQKEWQKETEKAGNKYVICRTKEEFKQAVRDYMAQPSSFFL